MVRKDFMRLCKGRPPTRTLDLEEMKRKHQKELEDKDKKIRNLEGEIAELVIFGEEKPTNAG